MTDLIRNLVGNATIRRFARFVVVGVINTLFGYSIYALLVFFGLIPHVAFSIAFAIGVLWNYWTHARFVFGQRGVRRLPMYVVGYLIVYGFNWTALHYTLALGVGPYLAQAMLAPVSAILSFILISRVLTGSLPWEKPAPGPDEPASR